jgi:hypothetical protein
VPAASRAARDGLPGDGGESGDCSSTQCRRGARGGCAARPLALLTRILPVPPPPPSLPTHPHNKPQPLPPTPTPQQNSPPPPPHPCRHQDGLCRPEEAPGARRSDRIPQEDDGMSTPPRPFDPSGRGTSWGGQPCPPPCGQGWQRGLRACAPDSSSHHHGEGTAVGGGRPEKEGAAPTFSLGHGSCRRSPPVSAASAFSTVRVRTEGEGGNPVQRPPDYTRQLAARGCMQVALSQCASRGGGGGGCMAVMRRILRSAKHEGCQQLHTVGWMVGGGEQTITSRCLHCTAPASMARPDLHLPLLLLLLPYFCCHSPGGQHLPPSTVPPCAARKKHEGCGKFFAARVLAGHPLSIAPRSQCQKQLAGAPTPGHAAPCLGCQPPRVRAWPHTQNLPLAVQNAARLALT